MFAFSICDETDETVFLARDRLGIKPLYFSRQDDDLFWASEIQPLLRTEIDLTLDEQAIYNYFNLRYFAWPQTPFEQIQKIPPGTSLLYEDGEVSTEKFWTLEPTNLSGDLDSFADRFRTIFEESVTKRLMADVPLGAFLSGGLDSSSIVAIVSQELDQSFKTFSVGFADDSYDESDEAAFVADHFGTDHHEITVDLDSMDLFGDVVEQYREPLADAAALPTLALSRYASEHVKVVLTGEGADELFGGYWYTDGIPHHQQKFRMFPDFAFKLAGAIEPYSPVRKQTLQLSHFDLIKTPRVHEQRGRTESTV
jgi:asparagine synthase (glutamine-hydrolysing)